jgi:hemerythrin
MAELQQGVAWRESYRLGDERVDSQHYQIFALLSELVCACQDGSGIEKLKETVDFLVNYTVKHFYDEESIQVQYNFPEYKKHKQQHEDFKATVGEIVQRFNENGSSIKLYSDVNKIIVRWLITHITQEDMKIGKADTL